MINVLGSTKIDEALGGLGRVLEEFVAKYPDLRINDVGVVLDISFDHDGRRSSTGNFIYACSDGRPWVQAAMFTCAAEVVWAGPEVEDEDE